MQHTEVVVVGAGVVGCAIARALAPDHDVTVIERGQVAGEATGKASGIISPQLEYEFAPEAAKHALAFVERYDGHRNVDYTERPFVLLVGPDRVADAREYADLISSVGFEVTYLETDALERRFPDVFDLSTFAGGVVVERVGWLDPYTFATALVQDAVEQGARLKTGTEVEAIRVANDRVQGIETANDRIQADTVVVAAGWWTRPLLANIVEVPVRPERYQTVNLETDRELDGRFPMATADDPSHYWRPEHNGDLHVGGGSHFVTPPGGIQTNADESFLREVAEAIPGRIKGLDTARIASDDVCPTGDAVTPDRYPILDAPTGAPDGLVVATGFSGYGVMASPFAGTTARNIVTDEVPPFSTEHFSLDRFEDRSADFDRPSFPSFRAHRPMSVE
jgi:glycine/D-amino acid oxidase-like deaminating enzyme